MQPDAHVSDRRGSQFVWAAVLIIGGALLLNL